MRAELQAAVDAYFVALDALDVEGVVALFAPGGTLECVTDGRAPRGAEELRAFFHGVCDGSQEMDHPVTWIAVDVPGLAVATIQDYRDVRSTGAVYDERTCNLFRFERAGGAGGAGGTGALLIRSIRFWRAP